MRVEKSSLSALVTDGGACSQLISRVSRGKNSCGPRPHVQNQHEM